MSFVARLPISRQAKAVSFQKLAAGRLCNFFSWSGVIESVNVQ
jgi:hypothetical protein